MSLLDEISRLNEGFSPEELMRMPEQEGLARQDARLREIQTPDSKEIGGGFDDNFLNRIMQIESGGNPRARTGSYKGLFQLSDEEFNRYGGGDIYDPNDNRNAAIRKLGAEREMFRKRYGEDPSPTDLYMMHQQGEAGYAAHRANPNAPAWQNMLSTGEGKQKGAGWARQAIWGNVPDNLKRQYGSVDNVTSADFVNMWRGKVEGGGNAEEVRDAAPNEATAFDPTGRTRMANGDQQGILPLLGMQNQQPQGLLGALGDPETMSYIAMMLKGMNPYSNLDPNAMLSSAHTNALRRQQLMQQAAEQATDNRRADRALNLRESEYGEARTERQAREAERMRLKQEAADLAASQRKADAGFYDPAKPDMPSDPAAPLDPTAPVPSAAPPIMSKEQEIEKIDQYLQQNSQNMSPAGIARMEKRKAALEKPPSASTQKLITDAQKETQPLLATKDKLQRMQELLPNVAEGYGAGLYGDVGGRLPLGLAPQAAKDTLEFNNLASIETIRDLSRTMKGSTAVKEMEVWLSKAADASLPKSVRQSNLNLAIKAIDRELADREGRIKGLQEGTFGRPQSGQPKSSGGGGGGGSDPLGIR